MRFFPHSHIAKAVSVICLLAGLAFTGARIDARVFPGKQRARTIRAARVELEHESDAAHEGSSFLGLTRADSGDSGFDGPGVLTPAKNSVPVSSTLVLPAPPETVLPPGPAFTKATPRAPPLL